MPQTSEQRETAGGGELAEGLGNPHGSLHINGIKLSPPTLCSCLNARTRTRGTGLGILSDSGILKLIIQKFCGVGGFGFLILVATCRGSFSSWKDMPRQYDTPPPRDLGYIKL